MTEKEILQTAIDFVEGRVSIKDFEIFAKTNQPFRNLIKDYDDHQSNAMYSNPLDLFDNARYDYICEEYRVYSRVYWFLVEKGIKVSLSQEVRDKHRKFCDKFYPSYLSSNELKYFKKFVYENLPNGLTEEEQGIWIKKAAKIIYKSKSKVPKWVQGTTDWPMDKNGNPMVFIKQIDKDNYSTYLFQSEDGEEEVSLEELD